MRKLIVELDNAEIAHLDDVLGFQPTVADEVHTPSCSWRRTPRRHERKARLQKPYLCHSVSQTFLAIWLADTLPSASITRCTEIFARAGFRPVVRPLTLPNPSLFDIHYSAGRITPAPSLWFCPGSSASLPYHKDCIDRSKAPRNSALAHRKVIA